jgi:hypothetical protein
MKRTKSYIIPGIIAIKKLSLIVELNIYYQKELDSRECENIIIITYLN